MRTMPLHQVIEQLMQLNLDEPLAVEFKGERYELIHCAMQGAQLVDIKVKHL